MTVINDFLKHIEPEKRIQLERIRAIAKKIVPAAEETITYAIPTLKYNGKSFLGFNAYKHHIGIYPYGGEPIEVFKDQLKDYTCSKGAIQVPYDKPFPEELLKEIINYRIKKITDNS